MQDQETLEKKTVSVAFHRKRRWWVLSLLLGFVLAASLAVPALRVAGRWLIFEDPLARADAIFVHAGHIPYRALEAAELYRAGWAPIIWLAPIAPTPAGQALHDLGIERPQGWYYNRQVLELQGVPAESVTLLDRKVLNTSDEIETVIEKLEKEGLRRVILVTSKQHSRRVRVIWDRTAGPPLEAVVRYAQSDPLDPDLWWANTDDAQRVVHEFFGIFNAWLGSPLRPEEGQKPVPSNE